MASATALVVANMIGAGIFTMSGFTLADLQNRQHVLLAWMVGGLIAMGGAIGYGRLAKHITESGGEYLFLSRTVHPFAGFMAGWISLFVGFAGAIAYAAKTFEVYALPVLKPEWQPASGWLAVGVVLVFAAINAPLVKPGVWLQNGIVAAKFLMLAGFIGFAFWHRSEWLGPSYKPQSIGEFSWLTFSSALVWISLAYSGFNAAVYVTEEVQEPRRNVPRALFLGTAIVTILYLALNVLYMYVTLPKTVEMQPDIAAVVGKAIGGDRLEVTVRLVICLALLSSVSSMIIAGPRVYAKMADDGLFPGVLRSHSESPRAAMMLQVVVACAFILLTQLEGLMKYLAIMLSVSAAGTVASLLLVKKDATANDETSPVATGLRLLGTALSSLFVIATLGLATLSCFDLIKSEAMPWQLLTAAVTLLLGSACYLYFSRQRRAISR